MPSPQNPSLFFRSLVLVLRLRCRDILFFFLGFGPCDAYNLAAIGHAHQAYALGVAAADADIIYAGADNGAVVGDEKDILARLYQ